MAVKSEHKGRRFRALFQNVKRLAPYASGVGVALSSFFAIARWPDDGVKGFLQTLFIGAVIGASIYASIATLHVLLRSLLDRLPDAMRMGTHVLISIIGGFIGGVYGLILGVRLMGGRMTVGGLLQGRGWLFAVFSAGIAVLVSFAFRAFELLHHRLREREWAEKELEIARSIQTRLLPPEEIEGKTFAISARNLPARMVAGDFYDVVQLDDGSVAVVVADVAGKGMGASLIMASVKAVLPFVARQSVAEAMNTLNAKLVKELARREFVALTVARYFPAEGTLHVVNAGCPDPYLLRNGSIDVIAAQGPRLPLGVREDIRYEVAVSHVRSGDRLVFLGWHPRGTDCHRSAARLRARRGDPAQHARRAGAVSVAGASGGADDASGRLDGAGVGRPLGVRWR
jgi:hypothetical protein